MNKKIYQVIHEYDVDGGYGDAVGCEDVIAVFSKKEDADAFVEKYANPHVYDTPYADLCCGKLVVKEMIVLDSIDDFVEEDHKDDLTWIYDEWMKNENVY